MVMEMNLGSRITKIRKIKKITQQDLAQKLFVTDKTISSWESSRTEPSLDMVVKLSDILDCSPSFLIYGDTKSSDIETEIKIKLSEDEFKNFRLLMDTEAKFLKETNQTDIYYQPTYRKFLKENEESIDEWLRIGIRGSKKILNYKNWHGNMFCDEYEVEINDEKNLEKIFKIIGLEEIAIVKKIRNIYLYQNKYEVSLDFVENLGYFIEIEVKKYDETPLKEYDNLLKVASFLNLNLNNIDKRGYPYHLIYDKWFN